MERKKYENDFKVMVVELLESGRTVKELSDEYAINSGIIRRFLSQIQQRTFT